MNYGLLDKTMHICASHRAKDYGVHRYGAGRKKSHSFVYCLGVYVYSAKGVLILESTGVKLVVLTSLGSWADNTYARTAYPREGGRGGGGEKKKLLLGGSNVRNKVIPPCPSSFSMMDL